MLGFIRGLSLFRKGLMVEDTPTVPIRSAAMGIVQVHGHAGGDTPFPSPVSGTACYAFEVKIERCNFRGWRHHRTDQNGRRFYLTDESGRIRVDPVEARFEVPVNCRRIVGASAGSIFSGIMDMVRPSRSELSDNVFVDPRTDDELREYAGVGYGCRDAFRFVEYCIRPDQEYDVLGTCVENPRPEDENDRNLITKGTHNRTFLISSKTAEELRQGMSWRSAAMIWGGAALAVASAVLFMARHGLL
ncbi:MAG: GIDE domain-containing protein [Acidobacteriota bacterium]